MPHEGVLKKHGFCTRSLSQSHLWVDLESLTWTRSFDSNVLLTKAVFLWLGSFVQAFFPLS